MEDAARTVVIVFIEHRPFKLLVEESHLYFRCICFLHLFPGSFHNALVILNRFPAAETFHLFGDRSDEFDRHLLQQVSTRLHIRFSKCSQEVLFVFMQITRE